MSMILSLVALGDANVERLLRDPPLAWLALDPSERGPYEAARAEAAKPASALARLFGRKPAPAPVPDLELEPGEGAQLDLDKAWHGIHYLLTGRAWDGELPLGFLVTGGTEVGTAEVGYGPPRALRAVEVRAVRDALRAIRVEDLRARFDPADMTAQEIYPSIWYRDPEEDDALGYVLERFEPLRTFLEAAADSGRGVVLFLT